MNPITKETPRVPFTCQGLPLEVVVPYKVGDTISTEGEASSMNQTYAENVRNNCAKAFKAMIEATGADSPKTLAAAQAELDKYMQSYEFGVRTGGGRAADPATSIALGMAKDLVKAKYKKDGRKAADWTAAELSADARKVCDANPQLMDYAKKQVAAKKNATKGIQV